MARNAAIKIGLAEEAAIDRIGQIVRVREFSRVDNSQPPALIGGEPLDPFSRFLRHRRRDGVKDLNAGRGDAMGERRQRKAVDAAADRDRQRSAYARQDGG